jgi:small subunit ribosomal protein S20
MPLLKHAKKKLRQDKKRTLANKKVKVTYKEQVKAAKEAPNGETLSAAFSSVDKAVKHHLIHPNKAARMKSSLSKLTVEGVAAAKSTAKKNPITKKAKATKVKETKAAAKKTSTKTTKRK